MVATGAVGQGTGTASLFIKRHLFLQVSSTTGCELVGSRSDLEWRASVGLRYVHYGTLAKQSDLPHCLADNSFVMMTLGGIFERNAETWPRWSA